MTFSHLLTSCAHVGLKTASQVVGPMRASAKGYGARAYSHLTGPKKDSLESDVVKVFFGVTVLYSSAFALSLYGKDRTEKSPPDHDIALLFGPG